MSALADLSGQLALVTGGSRGIGRAVARRLAEAGADVAISYRREAEQAEDLVRELQADGHRAAALRADLSVPGSARELHAACRAGLGPPRIVVCNAGVASRGLSVTDTPADEWARLWQVHVQSTVDLIGAAAPPMRAAGGGAIVVVSSAYAQSCPPGTGPYAAAKRAVEAVVSVAAKEERGYGIRVNAVAPGLVATDMGDRLVRSLSGHASAAELDARFPFGRVCRPEDVADVVLFAAGPLSSYLTGQCLTVDGGGAAGLDMPGQAAAAT